MTAHLVHPRTDNHVIRLLMAPPVGGSLYQTFGFRAPFILCIIFAFTDLIGRLLVIEVPAKMASVARETTEIPADSESKDPNSPRVNASAIPQNDDVQLTFVAAFFILARSSRALTAGFAALVFGSVIFSRLFEARLTVTEV